MDMRSIAERDLGDILEGECAFRTPVTVIDPDENTNAEIIYGQSGDISELIDPETGQGISGRSAVIAIRISTLTAAGLGLPVGTTDNSKPPWRIDFSDVNGIAHTFKVVEGNPDRTIGIVNCILELYKV